MSANRIDFIVNNQKISIDVVQGEMLSDLLRNRLGLLGTKIGCNESECGACTVVIDGQAVLSCNYPAVKVNGKSVVTIEGLSTVDEGGKNILHPLQDAFVKYGAVQCGFCIPGQIMTSYALLESNPKPSVDEIKYALKDTLCRCAGYPSIIGAIQAASENISQGLPIQMPEIEVAHDSKRIVGQAYQRPDAFDKVTGKAIYSDDIKFDGMAYARVKRAMIPSAILLS
ncbi:MAG: aldehyde oxidoreductase, partial [Chloroflexi bacterium HGW-Chloroflexi-8]